jgi:signal transduction histidine kinase
VLLFLLASSLFGAEEISELLERWYRVESALNNWYPPHVTQAVPADAADGETAELLSTLEQFKEILEAFTASLLFLQYEGTGFLPEGSGKTICQMTEEFYSSIVKTAAMERNDGGRSGILAAKEALVRKADAIRKELYNWYRVDSQISSVVFSRFVKIFGIFSFGIIFYVVLIWFLYRALRRARVQEQASTDFSRITMRAQEKERAVISAELHDTVLQDMGRLLQISKGNAEDENGPFTELAGKIMARTREICRELMPPDFSRLVLADSLVQLCADFEKRASVECRPVIDRDFSADRLSPQMQLQIYRIVQEALSNIEKHAEAKEVTLSARNREDALLIVVTDDGKGMSPAGAPKQSGQGLGIRGMYQRASMLGASLSFIPGAGKGLTVRLEAPFP